VIKHTFAAFCISGFLSFGVGPPLAAQIETSPEVLDEDEQEGVIDDPEVIEGDDSTGLPGVGDFPDDDNLPGADGETAEGVIRLEIDGNRYLMCSSNSMKPSVIRPIFLHIALIVVRQPLTMGLL